MSPKSKSILAWIASLALHGIILLLLGEWALPRMVAMKGFAKDSFRVELSVVESIEEPTPSPLPEPIVISEEVITTDQHEAEPVPIVDPIKKPKLSPEMKPQNDHRLQEKKKTKTPLNPPQARERGDIEEAAVSEILKQVKPRYPPAAIRAGHEGTVSLVLDIDERGRVNEVTINQSSGREDCDRAAVDALKSWWRFRAAGKPYRRSINIHFKLE